MTVNDVQNAIRDIVETDEVSFAVVNVVVGSFTDPVIRVAASVKTLIVHVDVRHGESVLISGSEPPVEILANDNGVILELVISADSVGADEFLLSV